MLLYGNGDWFFDLVYLVSLFLFFGILNRYFGE